MVYRNNAGRLGAGFISVCLETRWLGQKRGFYGRNDPVAYEAEVRILFIINKYPNEHHLLNSYVHMHISIQRESPGMNVILVCVRLLVFCRCSYLEGQAH